MTQDSTEPKEDEARDPGEELLLQTETNDGTAPAEVDRLKTADKDPVATETDDTETLCGIAGYYPSWLQWFASKKTYVIVFGLIGMVKIMIGTYYVSSISTLEKRFKIPSRTSGMIFGASDLGGLSASFLLSYLGSRGHKTRWVAAGAFLGAITCFIRYLPHVIYGPGQDALELTLEYGGDFEVTKNFSDTTSNSGDSSKVFLCGSEYENLEDCSISATSTIPTAILFVAQLLLGIGSCMYYTLGIAYMDDNVSKNKTPLLLAAWHCIKLLGPTCGYLLGSYALQLYVDPSLHPTITMDDPRWIGAWWLGWVPLGVIMAVLALMLALFPKTLPRAARRSKLRGEPPPTTTKSFSDFKMVIKRLLKNKVLVLNSLSSTCFMFGNIGYYTFMPKYMETQFRQSASTSSFITGTIGLIFSAIGLLLAGAVISIFKPRARYVAGWNVIVETLDVLGHISYGFLNCAADDLHGSRASDKSWDLSASCNADCDCGPMMKYSPVCSSDGNTTFYSPCHAGCTTMDLINGTKIFGNCSCIGDGSGWATDGACPVDCGSIFTVFLVVQSIIRIFSASGRAGNTIVQFRCVDNDDKAMSISFTEALLCSLALVPGPIVYGMLLDTACIVWGQTCGHSGNCWLYDGQQLGYLLNFTASGCLVAGTLLDIGVWYYVKGLQIYDDDVEGKREEKG